MDISEKNFEATIEAALSKIIRELNERFGTPFTEEDKVFIQQLEAKLADNEALEKAVRANTPDNARLAFDHTDDPEFSRVFFEWLFDRYLKGTKKS